MNLIYRGFAVIVCAAAGLILDAQYSKNLKVNLVRADDKHKVDIFIDGSFFTSYQYPLNIEKTFLFPVNAPDG